MKISLLFLAILLLFNANTYGETRAFPGAEGWGAYSLGGRDGDVYHVINLNDSGAGSLRYGITSAGGTVSTPRTIVFDLSGTIQLASSLNINKSYITIAGQTAPGDGICLRDRNLRINASHVIVRYLRVRLGDESLTEDDAVSIQSGNNIIMDHISASWSVDECFSCSTSQPTLSNVTVQWSIISEALWHSVHDKGTHSYGSLIRGCYDAKYTYHHNLYAHNYSRNPRPGNYDSTVSDGNPYWEDPCGLLFDFRNNVIYNWGGSRPGYDGDLDSVCRYNYVGNYVKPGYNGSAGYLYSAACTYFKGYYAENYFNGTYLADDWTKVYWDTSKGGWTSAQRVAYKKSLPFPTGPIMTDTALAAYQRVLNHCGSSLPVRDTVDTRVVNDVINGTGQIIDTQSQVGGWPTLNSAPAPLDTDMDGMPDAWENANGLNYNNAADRNYYTLDSEYTNLEVYLNSLIPVGTYTEDTAAPTPNPMTWQAVPESAGATQITMAATTGTDASGVEYYFANLTVTNGSHDSGWQSSPTYKDTGLATGVTYAYAVKARDLSSYHNETGWSVQASATTEADTTAPTPNPMSWSVIPNAVNSNMVTMTAIAAIDVSGIEYYFECVYGGGHNSGWQDSAIFTDTGLDASTQYGYRVKARDKSPNQNETNWSPISYVITFAPTIISPPGAYWMLDEVDGAIANEVTGSAFLAGTLQGTTMPTWATGRFGNCLTFSAGGGKVYVPSSAAIDFGDEDLSVSLWAKQPTSFSGQYELFIKGTIGGGAFPGSGKRYELYRKDSNFRFAIDDNVTKSELSLATTSFCNGNWVHIVAVRDTAANQIRLYADGVFKGTANDNTGSISQTEPMYIADGVFSGSIDDVRVYRYALTQDHITAIYNGAGVADFYCIGQIASDFDENCKVDFYDYAIMSDGWVGSCQEILQFADDWLICNRMPADQCWQY
ncbi:MAG: hypothetical protein A2Y10_11300 [Planctomycetes bacterium GWF2_41_51]|nr:MAG: hypothetical protein A2Y10_11300 [Planctomycetes bacterium GWF2_41_51]